MYNIKLLKAVADETRLNIVLCLKDKSRSVSEIVSIVKKSQPNVSLALRVLEEAGLVAKEKKGRQIFYKIAEEERVNKILEIMKDEE